MPAAPFGCLFDTYLIALSCAGMALTEVSNDRLHLALTAPAARLALALCGQVAAGFAAAAAPGTPAASPSGSSAGSPAARSHAQRAAPRDPGGTGVMDDVQEDAFRRCGPALPQAGIRMLSLLLVFYSDPAASALRMARACHGRRAEKGHGF